MLGIGKIHDIYNGRGVDNYVTTKNNADGVSKIMEALARQPDGLIFANLVDFDMLYGHRKDVEGFAKSLEEFDWLLGPLLGALRASDLLMLTADHGCDPDPVNPTTDHSREYVPNCRFHPGAWRRSESRDAVDVGGHGTDGGGEFRREDSARRKFCRFDFGEVRYSHDWTATRIGSGEILFHLHRSGGRG